MRLAHCRDGNSWMGQGDHDEHEDGLNSCLNQLNMTNRGCKQGSVGLVWLCYATAPLLS